MENGGSRRSACGRSSVSWFPCVNDRQPSAIGIGLRATRGAIIRPFPPMLTRAFGDRSFALLASARKPELGRSRSIVANFPTFGRACAVVLPDCVRANDTAHVAPVPEARGLTFRTLHDTAGLAVGNAACRIGQR
jgi:hypothetical protein